MNESEATVTMPVNLPSEICAALMSQTSDAGPLTELQAVVIYQTIRQGLWWQQQKPNHPENPAPIDDPVVAFVESATESVTPFPKKWTGSVSKLLKNRNS